MQLPFIIAIGLVSYLYKIVEVCTIVHFARLLVVVLLDLEVHVIVTVHCLLLLSIDVIVVTELDRG